MKRTIRIAAVLASLGTCAGAPAQTVPESSPAPSLKVADGELKMGLLLQGWWVGDTSAPGPGSSLLGNNRGDDTFRLRRSEISLYGKVARDWGFLVMVDPAKSIAPQNAGTDAKILQDFSISYLGISGQELALGQRKVALTEEGVHSSSDLDFTERALVTKTFSDRREAGLFYRGDYGEHAGAMVSVTNGVPANVLDDSNDTVFVAGRFDLKPIRGLLVGGSGGYSGGETAAHLTRTRAGAHVRWDGPADMPIGFRAEYMRATDGQAGKADLRRDGWYASLLYTALGHYQVGVRYDELNANKDASGSRTKTLTAGFHYLVKGYARNATTSRNVNLKLDWYHVKDEARATDASYEQFVLAAQVAF